ncbi:hypothetical protein Gotur_034614, partial [Gossypium turneri]
YKHVRGRYKIVERSFHTSLFTYTTRERNGLVHVLEMKGLKWREQNHLMREVPVFAREKMEEEKRSVGW